MTLAFAFNATHGSDNIYAKPRRPRAVSGNSTDSTSSSLSEKTTCSSASLQHEPLASTTRPRGVTAAAAILPLVLGFRREQFMPREHSAYDQTAEEEKMGFRHV